MTAHELSVTRHIHAPPERLWTVWTEHLVDWWAPRPWTTRLIELDLRPGGRFASVMHGPNGEEHVGESVILETVPAKKVVFSDAFTAGWKPQQPFMVAEFTFVPDGKGTRYTATARHWTAEARKQHEDMGFEQGWTTVATQLAQIAEGAEK